MNRKQFLATIAVLPIVGRLIPKESTPTPGIEGKPFKLTLKEKYYTPEVLGLWGRPYSEMIDLPPAPGEKREWSKVKWIHLEDGPRLSLTVENHEIFQPNDILTDEHHQLYRLIIKSPIQGALLLSKF